MIKSYVEGENMFLLGEKHYFEIPLTQKNLELKIIKCGFEGRTISDYLENLQLTRIWWVILKISNLIKT